MNSLYLNKKHIKSFIIILIALFISYFYPVNLYKDNKNIVVSKVIDGDTVELNTGQRLRYIGIDTPEINFGKDPECFAIQAKEFKFKDFKEALNFVNKVGEKAEQENHHPNIYLYGWNKVRITLTTHAIKGLSINDFILASKIDRI